MYSSCVLRASTYRGAAESMHDVSWHAWLSFVSRGTEHVFSGEQRGVSAEDVALTRSRAQFARRISLFQVMKRKAETHSVIFLGVFATFEWQCVNVGMSMRWRGRLASMAMSSEVPLFASGDGAVMMVLSPSAICAFLFSRCLGVRSAPYSSADGFVSPRSGGFQWADLVGQGAGRCQMRWCASWTLCRRSLGRIRERVVSVLRSVLLSMVCRVSRAVF